MGSPLVAAIARDAASAVEEHWRGVGDTKRLSDWVDFLTVNRPPWVDQVIAKRVPLEHSWAGLDPTARLAYLSDVFAPFRPSLAELEALRDRL